MPFLTESNITLTFPDANGLRIANCNGYKALSGFSFKEMDACWYEQNSNTYWLFELKDFSSAALDKKSIEERSWDIAKKAYDSLCFFLSSKNQYPFAVDIDPCLPYVPDVNTEFKFVTIIHCDSSQRAGVQLINEKFRNKFKPYAELFNISYYAVVEHSRAIRMIPHGIVS
ncbi:hypothetical protein [Mucilaginibacter celer]|uniref:Uncharacterized protein n=1 Tax=Mucilaginibacter celer TaxID=2305508 RepID=A0A494VRD5_9SPHI|nr:hypothetical protein [Mucilaginibacter celer]AYL93915.1 hypothetical protein HYN43_000780 [Mucilaginibacter celer]